MLDFLDQNTRTRLASLFASLGNPVKLVFFRQKEACSSCLEQEEILRELSGLSKKIKLETYDFVLNGDEVMNYRIDKIPATAVVGRRDFGIRFFGLTTGYEFPNLIQDIVMASNEHSVLDPQLESMVKNVAYNVHLQVMVNLTCPHCSKMVQLAHQFAFLNENIKADMVDLTEFPYLAQRYNVTGVPKTVVNDGYSFIGAVQPETFYWEIRKALGV